jgi:hypothetical protein
VIDFLARLDEPRPAEQVAERASRGVEDVPLHAGDTHVLDQPPPEAIATAVDQEQASPWFQDAVHLGDGAVLMRIMVEAIGTCHHVEGAGWEGEALAVPLDCGEVFRVRSPARLALGEHRRDKVDPPDRGLRRSRPDPGREDPGAAPYVQDR